MINDIDIDAQYSLSWLGNSPDHPAADGGRDDWRGRTSCAGTGTMIRPEAGDRNG